MAYLKTRRHPAAAAHGYEWPDGDTVTEVADEHATELLRIPGGQFYEVLPGDPEYPEVDLSVELEDLDEAADETAPEEPPTGPSVHRRRERAPRANS